MNYIASLPFIALLIITIFQQEAHLLYVLNTFKVHGFLGLTFIYFIIFFIGKGKNKWFLTLALISLLLSFNLPKKQVLKDGVYNTHLAILSFNIYFKLSQNKTMAEVVRKHKPDVILFQEVSFKNVKFLESLSRAYPYRKVISKKGVFWPCRPLKV